MIIIDKPKLRFLLAGRTLTITVPPRAKPYRPHRPYAIGLNHRTTVCHAEILHTTITPDGLQLQIRQVTLDRPHLLAAQSEYGYTSNPHQALPDEPEAVHGKDLEQITTQANVRFQQTRRDETERQRIRSLTTRLKQAQREQNPDAIAQIKRELDVMEHEMRRAA